MSIYNYNRIESLEDIQELIDSGMDINLYGAGVRLWTFWNVLKERSFTLAVKQILVTNAAGNAKEFEGISIRAIDEADLGENDAILLTLSEAYTLAAVVKIEEYVHSDQIFILDFGFVERVRIDKVKNCLGDFVEHFEVQGDIVSDKANSYEKRVWTVWWQNPKNAPDVVRACFESWKNCIPDGYDINIITKENYQEYLDIPEYMLNLVETGEMCLAHLSDYIRFSLLYYYGGIWLDATVLLVDKIPNYVMDYDLYTRTYEGKDFGVDATWGIWFMTAKNSGNPLYKFVKEAHEQYWKNNREAIYYLITDYFIAIACDSCEGIIEHLKGIPTNNILAMELGKHLNEAYDKAKYDDYTKDTFFQKLTWHGSQYEENSFYRHIINQYLSEV